ncbi:hypothetical protein FNV43_RR24363 [Rhamnella rubrinervis]|uniref:WRKY domain-containing protein n=1 Tax=Rhamnella rubrinervis TaxID=2594499 RepID=A0A8K0DR13_9ROSA|nr:hypothetical protein FNV43_RR24363 [Rhamnella rubrinervis]
MGTTCPEQVSERLIKDQLRQGKELATQLQIVLHNPTGEDGSVTAKELAVKIVTCFTDTLSVLSSSSGGGGGDHVDHSHCDEPSSEDCGAETSTKRSPVGFKDGRGCYKRRKTSQSWTIKSSTTEDGHAWRKYGQKEILHAKYPRAYFRCTRKHDQGCRATKQVQQVQDEPVRLFQITYIGQHTCRGILKVPQVIIDSDPYDSNYHLGGSNISSVSRNVLPTTIKQEKFKEELGTPSSDHETSDHDDHDRHNQICPLDADIWSDLKGFELSDHHQADNNRECAVSIMYSFTETGSSSTSHDHGFDMDFVIKSIDFESDFHFDETQFPI